MSYRIVSEGHGEVDVEVTDAHGKPQTIARFQTVPEARAWIAQQEHKEAAVDGWERHAPRAEH
jgi:hypothetical protein